MLLPLQRMAAIAASLVGLACPPMAAAQFGAGPTDLTAQGTGSFTASIGGGDAASGAAWASALASALGVPVQGATFAATYRLAFRPDALGAGEHYLAAVDFRIGTHTGAYTFSYLAGQAIDPVTLSCGAGGCELYTDNLNGVAGSTRFDPSITVTSPAGIAGGNAVYRPVFVAGSFVADAAAIRTGEWRPTSAFLQFTAGASGPPDLTFTSASISPVPEPGALALALAGVVVVGVATRWRPRAR